MPITESPNVTAGLAPVVHICPILPRSLGRAFVFLVICLCLLRIALYRSFFTSHMSFLAATAPWGQVASEGRDVGTHRARQDSEAIP